MSRRAKLLAAGIAPHVVERLALSDRDLAEDGGDGSDLVACAIAAMRDMPAAARERFVATLSGATGSQHMQAVTRAVRRSGQKVAPDRLARDLIAIHVDGGDAETGVRHMLAAIAVAWRAGPGRDAPSITRAARAACGWSQVQFAQAIGVGHITVARWETGERRPDGATLTLLRLIADLPEVRERLAGGC